MQQVLAAKIAGFVLTLRENGFAVGVEEACDTLRVAEQCGVLARTLLRDGWRGLLCGRADEWHRFDDLFDSYWLPPTARKWCKHAAVVPARLCMTHQPMPPGAKPAPFCKPEWMPRMMV